MIRHNLVFVVFSLCTIGLMFSQVYGQESYNIPQWIKNNVKLWADNSLADSGFENSIQYLTNIGILHVPLQAQTISETKIPAWVKNTANWWADGRLSDGDFINEIGYLIKTGQIQFKTASQATTPSTTQHATVAPPTTPSATTPNATISQNFVSNTQPVPTTPPKPLVKPVKILLLVTNWQFIASTYPYSFQARAFDASQITGNQVDQNTFYQNWGTLQGVRVQAYLTSSDNKTSFATWDGLTNQFGYFVGSTLMQNEPTNQVYFVHFNATKSGMISASRTYQFELLDSRNMHLLGG